ncbi:MAG: ABC transporter permease [Candidatus Omnitrophica bacterium]|nr:ABC transporter permease [Candidatus Omnitrophota bacterium]
MPWKSASRAHLTHSVQQALEHVGDRMLGFFSYLGGTSLLFGRTVVSAVTTPFRRRLAIEQMDKVGVQSVPIVFLTALFTGIVLGMQTAYQLQQIGAETYIAKIVGLSIVRELGPVLTALVVTGRVGASITAELGTMRVTEQIDALESLATSPIQYLVVPRFVALLVMLPLLTVVADVVGIFGGYLLGVYKLGISPTLYLQMTWDVIQLKDVFTGLFKSALFAMIVATVASFEGFSTTGGAEGVGRSTTLAVVVSFILIVAADCLATAVFYFVFP